MINKILHKVRDNIQRYAEPWYGGYSFQGAVILGLAPIALPLYVGLRKGAMEAGVVVAIFYLSQFIAPLLGSLIDRLKIHRLIYILSYIFIGVGCLLFPLSHHVVPWMILAALIGFGVAASNTVTNLYIVELHPKNQWDQRIGWLQTLYGTGQAGGLLLVAVFGNHADWALYLSALLMIPGLYFGLKKLPNIKSNVIQKQTKSKELLHHVASASSWPRPFKHFHIMGVINLFRQVRGPFSFYILSVFFIMLSIWLIFNLYPLLMIHAYHINAHLSSLYYGIAATVGILAYPYSGSLANRIGDMPVLLIGIVMVLVSWFGMTIFSFFPTSMNAWLVPLFFMLTPIAWSPLIVVGTAMAPKMSHLLSGESIGIFNATVAIASCFGALLAGFIAHDLNYRMVVLVALMSIIIGLICILRLRAKQNAHE